MLLYQNVIGSWFCTVFATGINTSKFPVFYFAISDLDYWLGYCAIDYASNVLCNKILKMKIVSIINCLLMVKINFMIYFSLHKFSFVKAVEDLHSDSIADNYFRSSNYSFFMTANRKVSKQIACKFFCFEDLHLKSEIFTVYC